MKQNVLDGVYDLEELVNLAIIQKNLDENDIKISVVIPNYNYEKFIFERLYSILKQNIKIHELILLDDFSSDNSKKVFDMIEEKLGEYINITTNYNTKNSGNAFSQWNKGINLATGDYVWIAETDDYCANDFLSKVITPILKTDDIYISFSDTALIDVSGNIIQESVKDIVNPFNISKYRKSYVLSGKHCIKNGYSIVSPIINVSSCIIKKDNYDKIFKEAIKYRHSGDWVFYLNVIENKKIAFIDESLNYYRQHENSITSTMNKQERLNEIKNIHKYFEKRFSLSGEAIQKMCQYERDIAVKWNII